MSTNNLPPPTTRNLYKHSQSFLQSVVVRTMWCHHSGNLYTAIIIYALYHTCRWRYYSCPSGSDGLCQEGYYLHNPNSCSRLQPNSKSSQYTRSTSYRIPLKSNTIQSIEDFGFTPHYSKSREMKYSS